MGANVVDVVPRPLSILVGPVWFPLFSSPGTARHRSVVELHEEPTADDAFLVTAY